MTQNQGPVSEAEIEALREEMDAQREAIREALAEDLGGELADYRARRRIGYSHDHGDVIRFVVQLEYRLDETWAEVVRFDHDPKGEQGHDVTVEGVHMDVYRDGEKIRSPEIFPPMPTSEALTSAEEHLTQHGERYIKRFEGWHGIENR